MAKGPNFQNQLRAIPSIHQLVKHPEIQAFAANWQAPHDLLVACAQHITIKWREDILKGQRDISDRPVLDLLTDEVKTTLVDWLSPKLQKVINGTGIVLHTNLGRAVLGESAIKHVVEVASGYSNLEYDIEAGKRGSRHSHIEALVCRLTGAESAMVVNNNAAAVYLILREMADKKEVVVSRGQLVEIGGSFRVSEIMAESGAFLKEVGTSNKTHLFDYERAIHEDTALLMKVHPSNFRMIGFTESVSTAELVRLGTTHNVPVYEDLGSGVLMDLGKNGIGDEPLIQDVIATGIDVVSFSGDKLLGGPQAGIIAGKKEWIQRLKKNQLARVLRVDKMTLAALEATLRLYLLPDQAKEQIPTLREILLPLSDIEDKAKEFVHKLQTSRVDVEVEITDDVSEVGGGTLPGLSIPTKSVAFTFTNQSVHQVERAFRESTPPVIVRVAKDQIRLDFRTILPGEIDQLVQTVSDVCELKMD